MPKSHGELKTADYAAIHTELVALLDAARRAAARSVNALMTATYWAVGQRIVLFEQAGTERAAYGEALVERLAVDLSSRFGRGFSKQNLWQMRAFHLAWPLKRLERRPARQILQMPSGEFTSPEILQTATGQIGRLTEELDKTWAALEARRQGRA